LSEKITASTLAVIVVHLFGYPANIDEVQECCRDRKVFVIEDAAQGFGNAVLDAPNKKLGLMGDAGVFSFGRGKPLNAMHGGILVTNSEAIYEDAKKIYESIKHGSRFQYLKYFFMVGSYWAFSKPYLYWIPGGLPFLHLGETSFERDFVIAKGDNFARAIIDEIVSFLEEDKGTRAKNSSWYASNLEGLPFVRTPPNPCFPYLRYPFMVEDGRLRDGILKRLSSHGTGAALFYPSPLNELPGLKEILKDSNCYPNAKKLSKMLITLPVHGGVKQSDRQRIKTITEQVIKDECQPYVISH